MYEMHRTSTNREYDSPLLRERVVKPPKTYEFGVISQSGEIEYLTGISFDFVYARNRNWVPA